ncbi:MAG: transposase, partial [Selenomonas bovis]|nr:transposase [Selenomonas bovis]
NRQNRKDWIAIISTDMSLSEEEIIRLYGRRWDIEVFFKTCKSYLHLRSYHGLSYDALTAHVAFVFMRYMMLSVTKRKDEDERAIGELFYLMVKEIADVTFQQSMMILQEVMLASIKTVFHATDKQLQVIAQDFVNRLPEYMRSALQKSDGEFPFAVFCRELFGVLAPLAYFSFDVDSRLCVYSSRRQP